MKFKDLWGLILPLLAILVVVYIVKISDKVDKPAVENHAGAVDDSYYPSKQQAVGESLEKSDVQYHGGYAYVDMGTSVMWANNNLGAASPELTGDTYTWGEIKAQKGYSRNYKYGEGDWKVTKYCEEDESTSWAGEGQPDGLTKLLPEDDAACNSWGNGWRMPSSDEWKELSDKCNWKWVMYNDVYGFLVTAGNGNCIFLPANKKNARTNRVESLKYWSSSLAAANSAYCMDGDGSPRRGMNYEERRAPLPIRAVLPKEKAADFIEPEHSVVSSFPTKDPNHHEWVDLGLSVKWATCNVGAASPSEFGSVFLWGETEDKREKSTWDYKWFVPNTTYITKYGRTEDPKFWGNDGFPDDNTHLDSSDDAATVLWGSSWRTPTKEEFEELSQKCEWTKTEVDGCVGYVVTSTINGNYIFFPMTYNEHEGRYEGSYWSSDLSPESWRAWAKVFPFKGIMIAARIDSNPVRPVWDPTPRRAQSKPSSQPKYEMIQGHEGVDMGVSVKWAAYNLGADSMSDFGDYYAWGETMTKRCFEWNKYRYQRSGSTFDNIQFTRYNTKEQFGSVDYVTELKDNDDAASVRWGDKWRIPTAEQWKELQENCEWIWTEFKNTLGFIVVAKNGNKLFLPAAGVFSGSKLHFEREEGYYWTSSLAADPRRAYYCSIFDKQVKLDTRDRFAGLTIRPVAK